MKIRRDPQAHDAKGGSLYDEIECSKLEVAVQYSIDEDGGRTQYVIEARLRGKVYTCMHRFSDFLPLHVALLPYLGLGVPSRITSSSNSSSESSSVTLPATFPLAKSLFVTEAVKLDRVDKLNGYVSLCLDAAVDHGAFLPPLLCSFLELPPPMQPAKPSLDPFLKVCASAYVCVLLMFLPRRTAMTLSTLKWFRTKKCKAI